MQVKDKMLEETEAAIRAHHAQMLAKKQLALYVALLVDFIGQADFSVGLIQGPSRRVD